MGIPDFVKAFDKVSRRRLALKMSYYGIRNGTLNWITEFLHGRQQQVVVDSETSDPAEVTSGVPQVTVLGQTLFLIYINDIADNINFTMRLFAHDSVVYRQINSPDDHRILQEDFWFQQIKLLTLLKLFEDCIILILLSVSLFTLNPINCSLL